MSMSLSDGAIYPSWGTPRSEVYPSWSVPKSEKKRQQLVDAIKELEKIYRSDAPLADRYYKIIDLYYDGISHLCPVAGGHCWGYIDGPLDWNLQSNVEELIEIRSQIESGDAIGKEMGDESLPCGK